MQINKILFPTDFSRCAEHAFSHAAHLAAAFDAELLELHVAAHTPAGELQRQRAEMEAAGRRSKLRIVEVEGAASPARAILDYADRHEVDLVVMGTHGRHGVERVLLGSVAEAVIRKTRCPVYTVGEQAHDGGGNVKRLLVPVDFSDSTPRLLATARALAVAYGARIDLLHVVEEMVYPIVYGIDPVMPVARQVTGKARLALEELGAEALGDDVAFDSHVVIGKPSRTIVDIAQGLPADLIVIATHGLTGLRHLLLGSVTEAVIRKAPCPVFTVKSYGKGALDVPASNPQAEAAAMH